MEINVTFIAAMIVAICGIYLGAKKGLAKSIAGFIAFVATILMLGIFLRIYNTYTKGRMMDMVVAIVALVVLGVVYGVLKLIVKSVKAIAKLPVIAVVDKLVGAILGLVVVIGIYHIVVIMSTFGYLGNVGVKIIEDVRSNEYLQLVARYDVLELFTVWKNNIMDKIKGI